MTLSNTGRSAPGGTIFGRILQRTKLQDSAKYNELCPACSKVMASGLGSPPYRWNLPQR
ncbi:hypothetical protein SCLCIDRAFT_1217548 [Scleroderma citrinum Foug A]|uniref:Uncharacterized protein n=1 Tax=Scleroderma citrinum Foug A TaxID=1036808 RepID=A0A0C3A4I6_9AGAM|nr:hypothetical protein SCLCIDRAFT_1217548 [Scleroderma citrinum Foug A]